VRAALRVAEHLVVIAESDQHQMPLRGVERVELAVPVLVG
jgi:hypothetical protein